MTRAEPSRAFYNEWDAYAADWLRALAAAGHIAPGHVDTRSIRDLRADDLSGFRRVHLFAGIGGWDLALRLAGWPDDAEVWTCSCPCQPWSTAGKRLGTADERHLWPEAFRLIEERRPAVVFGEQVADKGGLEWVDHARSDLERAGYAFGVVNLCAAGFGAPHVRQRHFWVADASSDGRKGLQRCSEAQVSQDRPPQALDAWHGTGDPFEQWPQLLAGADVRRMADGVSSYLDVRPSLRCYGNAIVPQVGAAFVKAVMGALGSGAAPGSPRPGTDGGGA